MSKPSTPYPRKINQHDYMSLDLGNNRRLTVSYGGEKASGAIPNDVFVTWSLLLRPDGLSEKNLGNPKLSLTPAQLGFLRGMMGREMTNGDRVDAFAAALGSIWPTWNVPPRKYEVGEDVSYDFGPRRGGPDKGVVTKVGRTVTVKWARMGLIAMAADMLQEGGRR